MLTRIRIEAEGSTVNVVQDDLYAAYDAIVGVIWGPGVYHYARLGDEVIEQAEVPTDLALYTPRWYKGRAIMRFPIDSPHEIDSNRLRPRIEWFAAQDEQARSDGERAPEPSTPEGVEHPADGTLSPPITGDGTGEALPPIETPHGRTLR